MRQNHLLEKCKKKIAGLGETGRCLKWADGEAEAERSRGGGAEPAESGQYPLHARKGEKPKTGTVKIPLENKEREDMTMELTYEKCGNYLTPNLIPNREPEGELRKFGLMRQQIRCGG